MEKVIKTYNSSQKGQKIHACIWYPDAERFKEPVGILQIAHGMQDHIERFEAVAQYMTQRGFIVAGNDHLGHGESVNTKDEWGYFSGRNPEEHVVKDMFKLTSILKSKYPRMPYFLMGHSMGSFMTRKYITEYGHMLDGVAIFGTGNQPYPLLILGKFLSRCISILHGKKYISSWMNNIMFGHFNDKIKNARTKCDWISSDDEAVDKYLADEKCTFEFTISGCEMIYNTLLYIEKKSNMKKIPKALPIYLAAGEEDAVGEYSKRVLQLKEQYYKLGIDCECRIYTGCRHELHNEKDKDKVFEDLYKWLMSCIK